MINIKNLTKLINHLRKVNEKNFSMTLWTIGGDRWTGRPAKSLVSKMQTGEGDCGTAACIAGHASLLARAEQKQAFYRDWSDLKRACDWLNLDQQISANALFIPTHKNLSNITLDEALATLEHLKETAEAGQPEIRWTQGEREGA